MYRLAKRYLRECSDYARNSDHLLRYEQYSDKSFHDNLDVEGWVLSPHWEEYLCEDLYEDFICILIELHMYASYPRSIRSADLATKNLYNDLSIKN